MWEGMQSFYALSAPFLQVHMFTNPEALQTLSFWVYFLKFIYFERKRLKAHVQAGGGAEREGEIPKQAPGCLSEQSLMQDLNP